MKLRTSFFNFRVLLKNITRFAPLWILYAVGEVLGLMSLDLENEAAQIANDLCYLMGPVSIFHFAYALLVAACLFGDLFDGRLCNGLHAMPLRREGWLLTNIASGLVFALIPALAGGGVAALFLEEYWWIALVWQGTSLLQFVFFFGLAVFCAMCAGKRLGMVAMYGILNFLSMLILWVVTRLYEPLLPGVVISDFWFAKLCPVLSLFGSDYLDYTYDKILGGIFRGFIGESLRYLVICAGAGVVFLLLAWLLYRKRPLEKAGDFVAFRPMGAVFLLSYTFILGVLLYTFGDLLGSYRDYGFLAVGMLIGWFTGWMLLERTVKVFTKKVLLGLVAFLVFFAGSLGLTLVDPLGVVTYIPKTEEIASASMYLQNDIHNYDSNSGWDGWYITDPEEIAWVQELHQTMMHTPQGAGNMEGKNYRAHQLMYKLGNLDMSGQEYITIYVQYRLKNGMEVYRTYRIPVQSQAMEGLKTFFSDPRAVFSVTDYQQMKENIRDVTVYWADKDEMILYSDARQQELMAAIEADCKAGTMGQHASFHGDDDYVADIDINWNAVYKMGQMGDISGIRGDYVIVYKDCINTVAYLEDLLEE